MSHHSDDNNASADLREKFAQMAEKLGPTGDFPRGRVHPSDQGGFRLAVASKGDTVLVDFGKPVAWIGFSPTEARAFAKLLTKHAANAEGAANERSPVS